MSSQNPNENDLILGIDIGTTSVKVCVVNPKTNEIVAKYGKETQSNVPSDQGIEGNKQDVSKIISALNTCVAKLQKNLLQQIKRIGICGQMHGVMFWKDKPWARVEKDGNLIRYDVANDKVSALYTWQDNRCDSEFLANLPKPQSHLPVYAGFGTATIFWMNQHKPEKLKKFNNAGTIQDFTVTILCDLDKPIMSDQLATSWGYYDCVNHHFNIEILKNVDFPIDFLPDVKLSGSIAGLLSDNWHCIPKGTPIGVALGDLQCSFLSTLETDKDAVINISTSAQIGFIAKNYKPDNQPPSTTTPIEYIPYFDGQFLAVAASLNGGNALATFVKMLQQWTVELGFAAPQSKIWEKVIALGDNDDAVSDLIINPTCLGERYTQGLSGSVLNINIGNLQLGKVFRALCHGLIANLHKMMPKEILLDANISRIVGNGSGLSRNPVLQKQLQKLYQLPLVFTSGGDSAKGAALAMNFK